ncbi:MAG TPA: hypothetical protein VJ248_07480 [Candidatus Udaeobacter sp.]|nr:hypothetical protein [Candidatus Udaeobacter sp.]
MLDPNQLPILLKAIDFVFDEGRKILDERRERRKMNETGQSSDVQVPVEPIVEPDPVKEIPTPTRAPEPEKPQETKQDLLSSRIDEILWQSHELDVKHLVKLLETYSGNYRLAKEQYAKWGSELVPSIVVHRMTDAENSMLDTITQLEVILSKVYKKDINPVK